MVDQHADFARRYDEAMTSLALARRKMMRYEYWIRQHHPHAEVLPENEMKAALNDGSGGGGDA